VRAPQQRRARQTLERVLDEGAKLLSQEGYDGFSITDVCRRASVSPGALYDRVEGKSALFQAIHRRELERMTGEFLMILADDCPWGDVDSETLVRNVVRAVGRHYEQERGLLRAFILRAAADPRTRDEGATYAARLETAVITLLLTRQREYPHPEPDAAVRTVYRIVVDTLGWRTGFGADFHLTGGEPDLEWTRRLEDVAVHYLFSEPATRPTRGSEDVQGG
jgi:AcrR family transcriptional regulator